MYVQKLKWSVILDAGNAYPKGICIIYDEEFEANFMFRLNRTFIYDYQVLVIELIWHSMVTNLTRLHPLTTIGACTLVRTSTCMWHISCNLKTSEKYHLHK